MKKIISTFLALLFIAPAAFSEEKVVEDGPLKRADLITVKASLEDILVRRYTQELSSLVEYEQFYIGANFDLARVQNKKNLNTGDSDYNDLDLTYLNADELFESYAFTDASGSNPLENYTIKKVQVNVGLKPVLGDKTKKMVEEWLAKRVEQEFGSAGSIKVDYIQNQETSRGLMMRWLKDLQGLVGSLILALAILLGVVLWKLLSGSKEKDSLPATAPNVSIQSESQINGLDQMNSLSPSGEEVFVKAQAVTNKIKDLTEKITDDVDELIKEWCAKGEPGLYRLASFAEIATPILGTLSIPNEHKKKMGDIFSDMNSLKEDERLDILNKTYWDLVASLNLGVETIREPFSFVYNSNIDTLNKALVGDNLESQTVFTLYMPDSMRKVYLEELAEDKRLDLLKSAAHLSSISEENLKSIESHYAPYFEESVDESSVSMSLTFTKLVESLSWIDACHALPEIEGPVARQFKRSTPHVAYIKDWSEEDFRVVCKSASNESLLAYIVTLPEMKDKILSLVSPRAQNILEDDLEQADSLDKKQIEESLGKLNRKIESLVKQGTVDLNRTFKDEDEHKPNIKIAA